ncbi:MAG: phage head morphogenesis protein [Bacteroidetes bacterium]|nr:phage head morphogenesis protein [Bacteroidota bacterium]
MIPGGHDIIDQIIRKAALYAIPLYRLQVVKWIKELKRLDRESELKDLSRIGPKLESLYYQSIITAYLVGNGVAQKEIAFQEGEVREAKLLRFAEPDNMKIITDIMSKFPAAEKAFVMKKAIDYEAYKKITGYAKALAFSLARVEGQSAIDMVKKSLDDSFKDGQTFREWRKGVNVAFETAGWTPLSPWHLENVFRTNLMSVYSAGKYEFCQTADNVVDYEYSTVGDNRVRSSHAAMDGKIYAKDDPIWNTWMPPNGYQCRCTVIPITKAYAEANGIKFSTKLPKGAIADPDFAGLPTLANYNKSLQGKPIAQAPKLKAKPIDIDKIAKKGNEMMDKEIAKGKIGKPGSPDYAAQAKYLKEKYGINEQSAKQILSQWGLTSADENITMIGLQQYVAEKFGLTGGYNPAMKGGFAKINMQAADKLIADAIYTNTQAKLKSMGIEYVKVVRGMEIPLDEALKHSDFKRVWESGLKKEFMASAQTGSSLSAKYTFKAEMPMQPLSSFTTEMVTAERFAGNSSRKRRIVGVVMEVNVPVKDIFSYGGNGLGTIDEREIVICTNKLSGKFTLAEEITGSWE